MSSVSMGKAEGIMDINITKAKKNLDTLKDSLKDTQKASDGLGEQSKKTGQEIDGTSAKMGKSAKEAKNLSATLQSAANGFKKTGDTIKKVGTNLTLGVTTPLVGLGATFLNISMEFEQAMAKVKAVSGATGQDFVDLNNKAKELGASTEWSAKQVADAFGYMGMAGWDAGKMLDGIAPMLDLATAAGMDLATASDIVTDGLTAMGYGAEDTAQFCDALATAATATNTSVEQMGVAFRYAAPIAGALGMSIEDTSLALGLMANSGIKADQAGTSLRRMMVELGSGITLTGKELGKFHVETIDATTGGMVPLKDVIIDMREAFSKMTDAEKAANAETLSGKTGMSGLLAIVNSAPEDFDALVASLDDTSGASERMAEIMRDTGKTDVEKMKSAFEGLALSIGEILMPAFRDIVTKVAEFIDKVNELDDETKKLIVAIGMIAAAAPPAILVIGGLVSSMGTIISVVTSVSGALVALLNPVTAVVAAIAALGLGVAKMAADGDEAMSELNTTVKRVFDELKTMFGNIKKIFDRVVKDIAPVIEELKESFKNILRELAPVFEAAVILLWSFVDKVIAVVGGIINATKPLMKVVKDVCDFISNAIGLLVDMLTGDMDGMCEHIGGILDSLNNFVRDIIQTIVDFVIGCFETMGIDVVQVLKDWNKKVSDFFTGMFEDFKEFGGNLISGLVNGIKEKVTGVVDAVKDVGGKITDGFKNIMGIHSPSRVFQELGGYINQGLEKGLLTTQGLPTRAMDRIADEITKSGNTISENLITVNKDTNSIMYDDTYNRVNKTLDLYYKEKDKRISLLNKGTDETLKAIDQEISATQKAYDIKLKLMEQEYLAKTKLIDEESARQIEELQSKLDEMDAKKELESRNEEDAAYKSQYEEKLKEIALYSGDVKGLEKLEKELANMKAEREKTLLNRQREDEKKAIREQMQEIRDKAQADKEAIRDTYEAKKQQLEQQKADEIQYLQEMQTLLKDDFQKRKELEEVQTKIKSSEENKRTKKEKEELKTREKELNKSLGENKKSLEEFTDVTGEIANRAGDLFVQGFRSTEYELKSYLDEIIDKARRAQEEARAAMQAAANASLNVSYSTQRSNARSMAETARSYMKVEREEEKVTNLNKKANNSVKDVFNYKEFASVMKDVLKPSVTLNTQVKTEKVNEDTLVGKQEQMLRGLGFAY